MKTYISRFITCFLLCLCAFTLAAQTAPNLLLGGLIDATPLPANFVAFGAGVERGSQLNGSSAICHAVTLTAYTCAKTKFSGSTTSNTVELKQVVLSRYGFVVAVAADAGLATGANGGIGGAYQVGGDVLFSLGKLPVFKKNPGYFIGFEPGWDKRNVQTFTSSLGTVATARSALKPFVSQGTYTFFVGKGW